MPENKYIDNEVVRNAKLYEDRPWGSFAITFAQKVTIQGQDKDLVTKVIRVKPGEVLSEQKHAMRDEQWEILQGTALVTINEEQQEYKTGDIIYIAIGDWHRIQNPDSLEEMIFQEIISGTYDENDIERRNDKYGRDSAWTNSVV